jgi:hypothetical protein
MRLWAFWVPTTFTQYTGCCKNINVEDQVPKREEMITFECQSCYSKMRVKEWHNLQVICHFWFQLDFFLKALAATHCSGNTDKPHLAQSMHCNRTERNEGKWGLMGQKQQREVNLDYLNKSPSPSLAFKHNVSDEKRQSYWLLEEMCVTKSGVQCSVVTVPNICSILF